jgi:hypothetical protein
MAIAFSDILTTLYTFIEGLTPQVNAAYTFKRIDTDELIMSVPEQHDERRFLIEGGQTEFQNDRWSENSISLNKEFTLVVRYDGAFDVKSLESRMASDEESLITNLMSSAARTTDQNFIIYRSTEIDRANPLKPVVRMNFYTGYNLVYTA